MWPVGLAGLVYHLAFKTTTKTFPKGFEGRFHLLSYSNRLKKGGINAFTLA